MTPAITTRTRTIDGLRIRYAESDGHPDADALLLNPWPESLYAFTPTWERLAQHAALVTDWWASSAPGGDTSRRPGGDRAGREGA